MYPSFSYTELQKRFCEGFAFFPFNALEQYDDFIYKRYTCSDNAHRLLEVQREEYNFGRQYAKFLLQKLQQQDIPIAAQLLLQLEEVCLKLMESSEGNSKRPAIYHELADTISTYQRILSVYQHNVQEHIATQLSSMPDFPDAGTYVEIGADNIRQIEIVIMEFMQSTDIICTFLSSCINRRCGFDKLLFRKETWEQLKMLVSSTYELKEQQQETIVLLELWEKRIVRLNKLQIMN